MAQTEGYWERRGRAFIWGALVKGSAISAYGTWWLIEDMNLAGEGRLSLVLPARSANLIVLGLALLALGVGLSRLPSGPAGFSIGMGVFVGLPPVWLIGGFILGNLVADRGFESLMRTAGYERCQTGSPRATYDNTLRASNRYVLMQAGGCAALNLAPLR